MRSNEKTLSTASHDRSCSRHFLIFSLRVGFIPWNRKSNLYTKYTFIYLIIPNCWYGVKWFFCNLTFLYPTNLIVILCITTSCWVVTTLEYWFYINNYYVTNVALSQARNILLCCLTSIIIIHDSITTLLRE